MSAVGHDKAIYVGVTTGTGVHLFGHPDDSIVALAQSNTHFAMYTSKETAKGDM
jgi:hypothetical protein